jgi:vacuolar-type H+-ATPase subunit H
MAGDDPKSMVSLSPLDQIRFCEAEVTRRVAAARQSAEESLAGARSEAANLKKQAKARGLQRGQAQYEEVVSKAEENAQVIVAQARRRSEEMSQRGRRRIDEAVRRVASIIVGLEADEGNS